MRVLKTNTGTRYREKVIIDNKVIYSPRFERKSDAKDWKTRMLSERAKFMATGLEASPVPKKKSLSPTFESYSSSWLENRVRVRNSPRTYINYKSILRRHLYPEFGKLNLCKIGVPHFDRFSRKLMEAGHNAKGINLIFGVLKRVFLEAIKDEVIIKSPFQHFRDLKENPRPDVFLTDMEIKQILDANRSHFMYELLLVALNTGMRRGELAGLCWDRVNFENNLIEITRSRDRYGLNESLKTVKSRRHVPMNQSVRRVLMDLKLKKLNEKFVFCNFEGRPVAVNHIYRDFHHALKRALVKNKIRFHDLRHTFASHFMMKGGNIYDLQKILGHSSLEMTQRYAHLAPDHLVKAINILSFSSEFESENFEKGANKGPGKVLMLKKVNDID